MLSCLTCRVPGSDYEYLLFNQSPCLGCRRAVKDACAKQTLQRRDFKSPIRNTGGQYHRAGDDLASIGQRHHSLVPFSPKTDGRMRVDDLGAEVEGLLMGTAGDLFAADATGEPEVVPNHRAGSRLTSQRLRLNNNRA